MQDESFYLNLYESNKLRSCRKFIEKVDSADHLSQIAYHGRIDALMIYPKDLLTYDSILEAIKYAKSSNNMMTLGYLLALKEQFKRIPELPDEMYLEISKHLDDKTYANLTSLNKGIRNYFKSSSRLTPKETPKLYINNKKSEEIFETLSIGDIIYYSKYDTYYICDIDGMEKRLELNLIDIDGINGEQKININISMLSSLRDLHAYDDIFPGKSVRFYTRHLEGVDLNEKEIIQSFRKTNIKHKDMTLYETVGTLKGITYKFKFFLENIYDNLIEFARKETKRVDDIYRRVFDEKVFRNDPYRYIELMMVTNLYLETGLNDNETIWLIY